MSQAHAQPIRKNLSEEDRRFLFDLVRQVIENGFDSDSEPTEKDLPEPASEILRDPGGAFVTLEKAGELRGCVGMMNPLYPLYLTVASMAHAAAFKDRRFPPLTRAEWPQVDFEISILGPLTVCPDINLLELGKHGIMIKAHGLSAVFLPQVAKEQGWDLPTTMAQLCRKAGLPQDAWKSEDAEFFWYEAEVIRPDRSGLDHGAEARA